MTQFLIDLIVNSWELITTINPFGVLVAIQAAWQSWVDNSVPGK